jgi:hypothetical protein
MTITVIEDLIPLSWQEDLYASAKECFYIHKAETSYKESPNSFIQGMDIFIDENTIDSLQFVHYINWKSGDMTIMYPYLKPLIHMIGHRLGKKITNVIRMKINHQSPQPNFTKDNYNIVHTDDADPKRLTAVYYINDSDGDTFIFNEKYNVDWQTNPTERLTLAQRVTPQAGKVVVFPSTQMHAGSNPINTLSRWVLNIMFEVEQ